MHCRISEAIGSAKIKEEYTPGTRILLIKMYDPLNPVEPGMTGTVSFVDDIGTIHMNWDNGRTLGLIPEVDLFRKTDLQPPA